MKPTIRDAFPTLEQYELTYQYYEEAMQLVRQEHKKAIEKFDSWPINALIGQTIIGEEVGEAEQAGLDISFDLDNTGQANVFGFVLEHAQSAAMHIRQIQHILQCIKNTEEEEKNESRN